MISCSGQRLFRTMAHSTLWIAVLVVHVGCIIEAQQPSKSDQLLASEQEDAFIPAASQSVLYTKFGTNSLQTDHRQRFLRNRGKSSKAFSTLFPKSSITTTTPATTESVSDSEDSCSGKGDGYYPNLESDCTSYYFCAAGYQLTYLCPPGQRYNGKRCEEGYSCPKMEGSRRDCDQRLNGYYPGKRPGTYFYCYQNAKVVQLQCDEGKVFKNGKCSPSKAVATTPEPEETLENGNESCSGKRSGFYTKRKGGCRDYYYCINEEMTELKCKPDFVFNGDLCVYKERFTCPFDEDGKRVDAN